MHCLKCGCSESKIYDSRKSWKVNGVRKEREGVFRRRVCMKCGNKWTTEEISVVDLKMIELKATPVKPRKGRKQKDGTIPYYCGRCLHEIGPEALYCEICGGRIERRGIKNGNERKETAPVSVQRSEDS